MRYCYKCGKQLKDTAKFCSACGAPVKELAQVVKQPEPPVVVPAEPVQVAEVPPVQQIPVQQPPVQQPPVQQPPVQQVPVQQPPVQQVPVQQPPVQKKPVQKKEKPVRKQKAAVDHGRIWKNIGLGAARVVLCVMIFALLFSAVVIFQVRQAVSADSLQDTLSAVLSYSKLENIAASDIVAGVRDKDQSIIDWTVEQIELSYAYGGNRIDIPQRAVRNFMEDSSLLPFIADELGQIVVDIFQDTGDSGVTAEELEAFMRENKDHIGAIFGEEVKESDYAYMVGHVENSGILELVQVSTLKNDFPAVYNTVRIVGSYWFVGFLALMSLVMILLLALCNQWKVQKTCAQAGTVLTVQGAILVVASLLSMLLPDLWAGMFGKLEIVGLLVGAVLAENILCSVIILAVGLVLILAGVIRFGRKSKA